MPLAESGKDAGASDWIKGWETIFFAHVQFATPLIYLSRSAEQTSGT